MTTSTILFIFSFAALILMYVIICTISDNNSQLPKGIVVGLVTGFLLIVIIGTGVDIRRRSDPYKDKYLRHITDVAECEIDTTYTISNNKTDTTYTIFYNTKSNNE